MTDRPSLRPTPLSVYVLWHPDSADGAVLAEALYRWFVVPGDASPPRAADDQSHTPAAQPTGAGVPVYFRCVVAGDDPALVPPIHYVGAQINVVVLLVDAKMVDSDPWRRVVERLAASRDDTSLRLHTVALDASAANLHHELAKTQAIFLASPDEAALSDHERQVRRAERLRRALTGALARQLRAHNLGLPADAMPEPLRVFISHAKRDGERAARAVRDAVYSYGQLEAFFDAHDLAWGHDWAAGLRDNSRGSAAMISVVTPAYPTRPWCRRELQNARSPWRVKESKNVWTVVPVAATLAPGESTSRHDVYWSHTVPELGRVPATWWNDNAPAVLDRLMLDVLLSQVHQLDAKRLAEASLTASDEVYLTWIPDPYTLLGLPVWQRQGPLCLLYPGHGLSTDELDDLHRVLNGHHADEATAAPAITLRTFEEQASLIDERLTAQQLSAKRPVHADSRVVALSFGDAQDQKRFGVGSGHVHATMVRLTKFLIERGVRVSYGGTRFDRRDSFTETLIDTVSAHARLATGEAPRSPPPLINFVPWRAQRTLSVERRAALRHLVRFEQPLPPQMKDWTEARHREMAAASDEDEEATMWAARALTTMRTAMVQEVPAGLREPLPQPHLRLAVGGRTERYSGLMPGIAEELLLSAEANVPVLVLRMFGGMATVVADFLVNENASYPHQLTYDHQASQPWFAPIAARRNELDAERRYQDLRDTLYDVRRRIHAGEAPYDRVDRIKLLEAMRADSLAPVLPVLLAFVERRPPDKPTVSD